MPITCAALMCRAPSVIPDVGGNRARQCVQTTRAMSDIAARLCAHAPDVLVVVCPQGLRDATSWGICAETPLRGNFRELGAEHIGITLPGAPEAAARLAEAAREAQLATREVACMAIDQGPLVPLYFLQQVGWQGPTLLVCLPNSGRRDEATMGRAIARAADQAGQRWAVVAAGDMSHRLIPTAPDGYHPRAKDFDRIFKMRIDAGDLRGACTINPDLRALALENVTDACSVAAGAVDYRADGHHTYAYEGPFGVGYLEAILFEESAPWPWRAMFDIARQAMSAKIRHSPLRPAALPSSWNTSQGLFVSLRDAKGNLRGSVAHIEPLHGTLTEEIVACAATAVTQDSRFARVTAQELGELDIEIAMLTKPQLVRDLSTLDPQRYGVVVSSGRFRGAVLPRMPGVDTVELQLREAAIKGQLPAGRPWVIERFEAQQSSESKLRAQAHEARTRRAI